MLCRESPGSYYISILEYIVRKIKQFEEEWNETYPLEQPSFSIQMDGVELVASARKGGVVTDTHEKKKGKKSPKSP